MLELIEEGYDAEDRPGGRHLETAQPTVIAAIQAIGLYKFYKLDSAGWAERLAADPSQADHWKKVFEEHPRVLPAEHGEGQGLPCLVVTESATL